MASPLVSHPQRCACGDLCCHPHHWNPLAGDTSLLVEAHVLCMFVPCLFMGNAIRAVGSIVIVPAGLVTSIAGALVMFASFATESSKSLLFPVTVCSHPELTL